MTKVKKENEQAFAIHNVSGSTVTEVRQRELGELLPAVFLSGKDKVEQFQKELKSLLAKYDAELEIQDFGRNWSTDEKIVVTFAWDEDLSNRTNDGIVPDWVVGRWENGR
jgi:hypothetical protein